MSAPNDGGPAFPEVVTVDHVGRECTMDSVGSRLESRGGMTLRDYFAAKALAGLLANAGGPIQYNGMHGWGFCNCTPENVAITAYGLAEAMLAARNGGTKS